MRQRLPKAESYLEVKNEEDLFIFP